MLSDVVLNCLLFTSLFASLIACGKGLWVKEWLREYHLDLPHSPRDLIRTRQLRYQGLQIWNMRRIIAAISFFLQLSVTLFAIALVVAVWNIHPFLRYTLTALCVLWVFMTAFTAICPLFSIRCPFKSPLARALFRIASWVRRAFAWITHLSSYSLCDPRKPSDAEEDYATGETLEKREMKIVNNLDGWKLDIEALEYVNHEWWGNGKLQHINEAFKDVSRVGVEAAMGACECIDRIIASRPLGSRGSIDEGVKRLQEIREELEEDKESPYRAVGSSCVGGCKPLLSLCNTCGLHWPALGKPPAVYLRPC